MLGRARRRVLVIDSAQPRNYATHEMHGVLGHDGLDPADLRARGRAELARYGVEVITATVDGAEEIGGGIRLLSTRGADVGRTVLLATGMLDEVPDIAGFAVSAARDVPDRDRLSLLSTIGRAYTSRRTFAGNDFAFAGLFCAAGNANTT